MDVVWCNSTSAWVSLYDKSNNTIQKVIKNLVNCTEPKNYTVRTFAQYQDYLESMSTPVTNPSPLMGYRKRKLLEMASPDAGNSAKTPKIEPTTSNASELVSLHLSRFQLFLVSLAATFPRFSCELMYSFRELLDKIENNDYLERIYENRMQELPLNGFFGEEEMRKFRLLQEITPKVPTSRKVKSTTISTSKLLAKHLTYSQLYSLYLSISCLICIPIGVLLIPLCVYLFFSSEKPI